MRLGAKTIVAVGGDQTVSKVLNPMIAYNLTSPNNTSLAIIPVEKENNIIADSLGIPSEIAACDVLSARRIEKLDVGQAKSINSTTDNARYFLAQASIQSQGAVLEIDKKITIEVNDAGRIYFLNICDSNDLPENIKPDPQDGYLELYIEANVNKGFIKKETSKSILSFKRLLLMSPENNALVDGATTIPTPTEFAVVHKKLSVIVGKERNF
jgi:diacylglycerol kinase family enzyme